MQMCPKRVVSTAAGSSHTLDAASRGRGVGESGPVAHRRRQAALYAVAGGGSSGGDFPDLRPPAVRCELTRSRGGGSAGCRASRAGAASAGPAGRAPAAPPAVAARRPAGSLHREGTPEARALQSARNPRYVPTQSEALMGGGTSLGWGRQGPVPVPSLSLPTCVKSNLRASQKRVYEAGITCHVRRRYLVGYVGHFA